MRVCLCVSTILSYSVFLKNPDYALRSHNCMINTPGCLPTKFPETPHFPLLVGPTSHNRDSKWQTLPFPAPITFRHWCATQTLPREPKGEFAGGYGERISFLKKEPPRRKYFPPTLWRVVYAQCQKPQ